MCKYAHDMGGNMSCGTDAENFSFQKIVAVLGVSLMVIKFIAWGLTSSAAIFTDAVESIVNVIAAFVGLYALYLCACPRDRDHPFGHGRAELISSSVEGVMIVLAGVMIILEAVSSLMDPQELRSLDLGLVLVAAAAIANYLVGRAAIAKGRRNRSMALVASGKHLCSDTYSSIGIILGLVLMILLDNLGYHLEWLDGAIAMLFGAIILITGVKVVKDSMDGVMDKADTGTVGKVIEMINSRRHDHWVDVHNLRVSKYGSLLHIDVHMVFPANMTVEEQYREISELKEAVNQRFADVDLTVMGEPCNPKLCPVCGLEWCAKRSSPFDHRVEWTADTAMDENSSHRSG